MYTNREEWERKTPNEPYPENIAEVIIAKHRNGPTGQVPLFFRSDVVRFESLEQPVRTKEFA
jgi:replicative DNA helicase